MHIFSASFSITPLTPEGPFLEGTYLPDNAGRRACHKYALWDIVRYDATS